MLFIFAQLYAMPKLYWLNKHILSPYSLDTEEVSNRESLFRSQENDTVVGGTRMLFN